MQKLSITLLLTAISAVCLPTSALALTEQQAVTNADNAVRQYGATDNRAGEYLFAAGNWYHDHNQDQKAQNYYTRAMQAFEKHPGNHADMLRYYSDQLARVYVSEHKNDQVEQLFKRAVELANQLPGKDKTFVVPNTLAGLAQLYECEGRFADAEVALKQRIEMRHRFMNAGQIDPALVDLANLYTHWGKFDQARPLFEQLRTISPMPVAVRQGYSDFIAVSKGAPANQAAN